ncbi:MAG: recombinase family protein, partial [Faecalibacillus sp.]
MKRVVFYARVSTDHNEQLHSLSEQRKYFMRYINQKVDYQFVGEYVDEGISGTFMKNRISFNKMIYDAMQHKFDLILVKDISRFARNTLDTIEQTRKLKQNGIDVIFINDQIDTSQNDGELNLTLLASAAQDESRKISNRINWTIQNELKKGVMYLTSIYGYDIVDRQLYINEKEAEIVRRIYDLYLSGLGIKSISDKLYEMNIQPPKGGKRWNNKTISTILTNEKYMGTLVSGKTHVNNYLTHEREKIPKDRQYFFNNHHEAIITEDIFNKVQEEKSRRNKGRIYKKEKSLFSGKIQCFYCGNSYVIESRKKEYYYCLDYRLNRECQNSNSVYIETLKKMLYVILQDVCFNKEKVENMIIQSIKKNHAIIQLNQEKTKMEKRVDSLNKKKEEYLEKLLNDEITVDKYQSLLKHIENEIVNYQMRLQEIYDNDTECQFNKSLMYISQRIKSMLNDDQFYNKLIEKLVDKIIFRNRNDFDLYI